MTLRDRRRFLLLPGLAAVLALTACGGGAGGSAPPHGGTSSGASRAGVTALIVIRNFMFHPMSLTVAPGAVVTIRNQDSVTHTLTDKADPKLFGTGDIAPGGTRSIRAPDKAGSYPYICMIHQYMTGALVVR